MRPSATSRRTPAASRNPALRRVAVFLPLAALLAFAPAILPHPSATLSGRVTDGATGEAVPGATVTLAGTSYGAAADGDGRYRLVAPEGVYDVEVRFVGYAARTVRRVELYDGEVVTVDVTLRADGETGREVAEDRDGGDEGVLYEASPSVDDGGGEAGRGGATGSTATGAPRRDAPPSSPPPPPAMAAPGESSAGYSGRARPRTEAAPDGIAGERDRGSGPWGHPGAGLLTAGDVDDHLNWGWFLRYARRALDQGNAQVLPPAGLEDRVTLRIVDRNGRPASNARVRIVPEGQGRSREFIAGTDGRLHVYPARDFGGRVGRVRLEVRPPTGGSAHTERVDLRRRNDDAVTVRLPVRAGLPRALDVAVVLDVTGSMGDEHRYISDEFEHIVERVRQRYPGTDMRFGLVAYRDHGDDFIVRSYGFTSSVREMQERLAEQSAGGGGDYPEAMDEALEAALDLQWRSGNTARVLFLVADAPPHDERLGAALAQAEAARRAGIRIYPVAASGVGDTAEYLMRTAAVLTQGRHLFLTDDSGIGNSHAEPRVACYVVTSLAAQLSRVIEGELAGRYVEADGQDVVREVGRYEAGRCLDQPVTYVPRDQNQGRW